MEVRTDYSAVIEDLLARRQDAERRIGALRGEMSAIDAALAVLRPLATSVSGEPTMTGHIIDVVRDAGKWLSHSEIVRLVVPELTTGAARQRHVCRTLIGQLAHRGKLAQSGRLIGMPDWEPPRASPVQIDVTSGRNGRRAHLDAVLKEAARPLHVKEICAELLRREWDADERCVASSLEIGAKAQSPRWRKVGPAIYEWIHRNGEPPTVDAVDPVGGRVTE